MPTIVASGPSGGQTAAFTDPGCSDAVSAFESEGSSLMAGLSDPQAAKTVALDLQTKLQAASAKATDSGIRDAITKLAADFGQLATALSNNDQNAAQAEITTYVHDATTMVSVCTG
jgi:hypothetical protein